MARWPTSSRAAALGLAAMTVFLLYAPPAGATAGPGARLLVGVLCALPLLVLLATARRKRRSWGTWTAVMMIPYVALSVGSLLVNPDNRLPGIVFATIAVLTFFAGIDSSRRI